jgi:SAM-dependent methyltransferase
LTGIDVAPNEVTEGIRLVQGDILQYPIHDRFDAVLSFQVIEHMPDANEFVARLLQLVRPGGIVSTSTPNSAGALYAAARLGKAVGFDLAFNRLYSRHHLQHFTRRSLARLFSMHGCRVEQHWDHNAPIRAMDLPVSSKAAAAILRGGLCVLWGAGRLLRRSYLQTVICRVAGPPSGKLRSVSGSAHAFGNR